MELFLHSPLCLHGILLNYLRAGTLLPYVALITNLNMSFGFQASQFTKDNLAKFNKWFRRQHFLHQSTNKFHGAKPFLRSRYLGRYSRTSQDFMGPEGSLPCTQEPSTGPYPGPDRLSPYHYILSNIQFSIGHPPTSWSFQWSLSFRIFHEYPICIHLSPHSCYIPCLSSSLT
jgi:hypothetical protein